MVEILSDVLTSLRLSWKPGSLKILGSTLAHDSVAFSIHASTFSQALGLGKRRRVMKQLNVMVADYSKILGVLQRRTNNDGSRFSIGKGNGSILETL